MTRSFTILNTFNNYSIIMTNISNNIRISWESCCFTYFYFLSWFSRLFWWILCCFWAFWRSQKSYLGAMWKRNWLSLVSWTIVTLKLYTGFKIAKCKKSWLVKPWLNFDLNCKFKSFYSFSWKLKRGPKLNLSW